MKASPFTLPEAISFGCVEPFHMYLTIPQSTAHSREMIPRSHAVDNERTYATDIIYIRACRVLAFFGTGKAKQNSDD